MRRLAAIAAVFLAVTLPGSAQRSGGHGGFAGHSAASPRGGFRASAPFRSSAPAFSGNRPAYAPGYSSARGAYSSDNRSRRPIYRSPYVSGYPYGYVNPYWGATEWLGPGFLDYSGDTGYDGDTANGQDGYGPYPAPPDELAVQPPYPPYPYSQYTGPAYGAAPQAPAPEKGAAVTLVYKDGRPSEQVRNFILTRTTLSVWDGQHRDILVEDLDIPATEKANRAAGVDFELPADATTPAKPPSLQPNAMKRNNSL